MKLLKRISNWFSSKNDYFVRYYLYVKNENSERKRKIFTVEITEKTPELAFNKFVDTLNHAEKKSITLIEIKDKNDKKLLKRYYNRFQKVKKIKIKK